MLLIDVIPTDFSATMAFEYIGAVLGSGIVTDTFVICVSLSVAAYVFRSVYRMVAH
jgi:hypothetical protein